MSLSRRRLLEGAAGTATSLVLGGCKAKLPDACTDVTGLPEGEVQARMALAYVDATPFAGKKTCESCQQYVAPAKEGACGGCKVLRGPVHPNGYCKSYAQKT